MKARIYASAFLIGVLMTLSGFAQDFSNKGKEFWLAYCYHVGMVNSGGLPTMTLYITSDVNTTYSVEIFGLTTIQTGNITAGQVITVNIPTTYFIDNEGLFSNKAIRVTGTKPIVVYSYITRQAASGATLNLPTNVLGREYYSLNFTQISNEANSNSYFTIISTEDSSFVEITPSANTKNGWLANTVHTVMLNKGQIYQVLGATNGNNGVDLTGSKIKSIATGASGCKRIAVYSGSGKIRISASGTCNQSSSDNLYQQLYPTSTWGKKFLTVPSYNRPTNIYRIIRSSNAATVYLNGVVIPSGSFTNNVYQFFNSTSNLIEADQPVSVAQYFTTQGCDGNSAPYDPDMIVLNPVEQNISKVTLVSSNVAANNPQHHIHVIIKKGGSAQSSFTFDGTSVPLSSWINHPNESNYAYLYLNNVTQGYHQIASDSGFNALAYGYGDAESYGYSAGANVKDLYQYVAIQNQYATVNFPAACKSSPFYFSTVFPYQPTEIKWIFNGLFTDVIINAPVYDSSWTVNGKTLYRYKLTIPYTINAIGTYPIRIVAQNPTPDGCSGEQEVNYDLQVFERPVADFNFTSSGCVTDSVHFFDNANPDGRTIINYSWDFADGGTSNIKNPVHLFGNAGSYNVKYSVITDIGCLSDTISKTVTLSIPPVAKFGVSVPNCVNKTISISDSSTTVNGSIIKWYWNFGDGSPQVIATTNATQSHIYSTAGTYAVTLQVENSTGCKSFVFTKQVIVTANPVADFTFGNACLPAGNMQFTNTSTIADGTQNSFGYQWTFSDGGSSVVKDPAHNYSAVGPFSVKLVVTSNAGCVDSTTKTVNTIYAQPQAIFNVPTEVCDRTVLTLTDQSTAPNGTVAQWNWNFGDNNASTSQNPTHTYSAPGTYIITLTVTSAIGCVSTVAKDTIIINSLPTSNFSISNPNCVTRNITFTDGSVPNSGNITNWNWNFGDGSTQSSTTNAPQNHSYSTTGSFTAYLITQTNKGCISDTFKKLVDIHPLPVPGFTVPANCLTDPFSPFNDTSSIADGTQGGFTYLWNFGDPNATASNPNTSTVKNPTHKYTQTGNYNVTMTVTSIHGCASTLTQTFTLNGTVPQSVFAINGGIQHCSNNTVSITNNSTVDVGNIVKLEIFWDYANDPTNKTVVSYPPSGAIFNHTYPEFFTPATKNYDIRVVAYSGDACLHTSSQTVSMKATPDITFNTIPGVCADVDPYQVTQASVTNLTGVPVYSGTGISAAGMFNPQTAGVGTHTIRYTFNASNGCSNYKEQTITVYPVPTVNAGVDLFVLEGGNAVLQGSGNGNNLTYQWSPVAGLNNPAIAQPTVTPVDDITYTLMVTSSDNCKATDQVFIKVLKAPAIPNTFSPNGDGVHDRWEIKYLDTYPGAVIEIFNRYGQQVYRSIGYATPWDGKFQGKDLPAGTYYYIINPKNGRKQVAGFVDIIR